MKICYTEMTDLLQFIVNVRKFDSNLSALCCSCAKVAGCVSDLILMFLQDGSNTKKKKKLERATLLVRPPFFCKLRPSSNRTNKSLTELGLEIRTTLSR
jgi:hypothetical protein